MTFKPYPKYKASGVEWLGDVPEGWGVLKCSLIGTLFGSEQVPDESVTDEGELPFLKVGSMSANSFSIESWDWFVDRAVAFRYSPRSGYIVFPKRGAAIFNNKVNIVERPSLIDPNLMGWEIGNRADTTFIAYVLKTRRLNELADVSTVPQINNKHIAPERFPLPPICDQVTIATFLDRETAKVDILIAKQEAMIDLLQEKRQAVISHAVTKGLDPSVPMKSSGVEWLGDVPEHWAATPFKSAVGFQEGPGIMAVDFKDTGIPLLRIANVGSYYTTLEGCNFLDPEKVAKKWNHFRANIGDLLISASATMGTVTEVTKEAEGSVPYTGIIRLFPKAERSVRDFVRYFVVSTCFLRQIDLLKAGATIQHFGPTHLAQIKMALPPIAEQHQISEYLRQQLSKIDALIAKAQQAIVLQKEHRTALISAAVTGKIDVRNEVIERKAA